MAVSHGAMDWSVVLPDHTHLLFDKGMFYLIHLLSILSSPLESTRYPRGPESLTGMRLIMTCYEEILKLHVATLTPIKFPFNQHMFLEGKLVEEFQDGYYGGHLDI